MTLDQIILIITACISLLAVFVTYLSVRKMGKQVDIQKRQWEYSQKPIFRIIKSYKFGDVWVIMIENSNEVFHMIENVTFSSTDVLVSNFTQGTLKITTSSKSEEKEIFEGLSVTLKPQTNSFIEGNLQIRGKDLLGIPFICNSQPIKFKDDEIINKFDYYKVYFKFI